MNPVDWILMLMRMRTRLLVLMLGVEVDARAELAADEAVAVGYLSGAAAPGAGVP